MLELQLTPERGKRRKCASFFLTFFLHARLAKPTCFTSLKASIMVGETPSQEKKEAKSPYITLPIFGPTKGMAAAIRKLVAAQYW